MDPVLQARAKLSENKVNGPVHTLTCCTHIFLRTARSLRTSHTSSCVSHTRMAQVSWKGVCRMSVFVLYLAFSSLMFNPSLLFLYIHFDITIQSTILPYLPVLEAQDTRNSAPASRSLATWPSQRGRHRERDDQKVVHGEILHYHEVFPRTFHGHDAVSKLVDAGEIGVLEEAGCSPDQSYRAIALTSVIHPAAFGERKGARKYGRSNILLDWMG